MAFLKASKANVSHLFSRIGRVAGTDDVDGLRLTFEGGRILHIRPSGNAPELRCYVEADDPDAAEHLLAQGLAVLNSSMV